MCEVSKNCSCGDVCESIYDAGPESTPVHFINALEGLINTYSIENKWDMPDFLMAQLIWNFIDSVGPQMKKCLDWHGVDSVCHPKP